MGLIELEQALPGLLEFREDERRGVDWPVIEDGLEVSLPRDFVELCSWYPGFILDHFLNIPIPAPGEEAGFVSGIREILEDLKVLAQDGDSEGYVAHPEGGGLIPWGESVDGDIFYWKTAFSENDVWSIVLHSRNDDWVEFSGAMTDFLVHLLTGLVVSEALPPEFPGLPPSISV